MAQDISVFGLSLNLIASTTYPSGITITSFADNGDPLDSPDLTIADMALGPNGDSVTWSRPELIEITVNVIPQSDDDVNLQALVDANRVAKGKTSAKDAITHTWTYPNGATVTCSDGKCTVGPVVQSGTSEGRAKTKRYSFKFAKVARTGATS